MSIKAEIIVPTYGQENCTIKCFDALLKNTTDYRLVWVDNGSPGASRQAMHVSFLKHENRLSLWPGRNLGFVGGTNLGIRAILEIFPSDAEYVVLLNNDTEVTSGWLEDMIEILDNDPSLGAAGPFASCDGSWQGWKNVFKHWGENIPPELLDADPNTMQQYMKGRFGGTVKKVQMVAFFCTVIRKRIFEEIGLLDPQFGTGLGDDDDYCYRIQEAGYGIAFVPGVYIVHHHRTTFKACYSEEDIECMQWENVSKFRRKHGI